MTAFICIFFLGVIDGASTERGMSQSHFAVYRYREHYLSYSIFLCHPRGISVLSFYGGAGR